MNIAIFTNNYLPNPYGVSMSIESFRVEFEKMGHTVYIFAPEFKGYIDKNPNVFRYPSVDITLRGVRYPIAIPFSCKIDRILKKMDIDVVHAQHTSLLGWQAKRWAKKKNVPLIFTWHTLYDQYAHFAPLVPEKLAAWWAIGNAVRYANAASHIVVPTPSVKPIIKKWGVKNPNITAIASGIDEKKFSTSDGIQVRQKYGISVDDILILLVSRLTAEKNVYFIFESLMPLLKKNKKLKFLVAGGGIEKENLEKIVEKNGLAKQIFFAGIVSADIIKNYYAAADIFAYASKSETQGMILTEAMYMGLPTVAVKATGSKDLVGNFVTGILTKENEKEFKAAVSKLVDDPALRKKFSQNAKRIARESYTAGVCAEKMLEVYEKEVSHRSSVINKS